MPRNLPPLNALRAFEAAARHLSFVRAAEELHVTPAAISQQVKLLEDHLGVSLFHRGKKLALSEASSAVLPFVTEAFDQIELAMLKVQTNILRDTLVISASPAFAARWLIPRLEDFQSRHPNIELRLLATKRLVNFQVEDVDVAIRFGEGDFENLVAERLMPEAIIAIAAPMLAATINSPGDLTSCNLLEDESKTSNGCFPDWETWISTLGVSVITPLRIRHFGDADLTIQSAVSGLGAALTWQSLVAGDLKAGRLVRLLDQIIPTTFSFYLVAPKNRTNLHKVNIFRAWLLEQSEHHQINS
ncbi:MAG: transcriptional regulator GcvA [Gallionellaceae bacterium]|jgi:LysR family glycine cleavage system transcriptional activator